MTKLELTIERLFCDFAKSIAETANKQLEPYHAPGTICIPEEELQFWCGYIRDALRHSMDELPTNKSEEK